MSRPRRSALLPALALLLGGGAVVARSSEPAAAQVPPAADRHDDSSRAVRLGAELEVAGDAVGAAAAYRRASELDPASATPHVYLGRLALDGLRRFEAWQELRRALELEPERAEAHYLLGEVYDELGFDWLAKKRYRRAFELEPALADPLRHPEVSRNRQALATLLLLWQEESGVASGVADAGAGAATAAATATRAEAERSVRGEKTDAAGGGYARLTGGERSSPQVDSEPAGAESSTSAQPPRQRRPGSSPGSRTGSGRAATPGGQGLLVIDRTDLRSREGMNQLAPAEPGESRRPNASSRTPRFTPPPKPFEPEEDSTGRIEPRLEAPDRAVFAIAG